MNLNVVSVGYFESIKVFRGLKFFFLKDIIKLFLRFLFSHT